MNEPNATPERPIMSECKPTDSSKTKTDLVWVTPKMEDVSEQVMAQPYIRFT